MTNLSTTSRQPWLTRGRLLVGLPLGLGALVSFGLMTVGVRPLLQTVQGLEERRDTLLSLQRSAPALERQLNQAETELRMAEEKQALLLNLLAGRDKVQTFLALLNQQAVASGVQMRATNRSKLLHYLRGNPGGTTTDPTGRRRLNSHKIHCKRLAIASPLLPSK